MKTFSEYLKQNGFKDDTIYAYGVRLNIFLSAVPNAVNATYSDILSYFEKLNRQEKSVNTRSGVLSMIKRYYDYLLATGQRDTHPCKAFNIKGKVKRGVIHNDLFSRSELESLFDIEPVEPENENQLHTAIKRKVMLSMLIYQAMLPNEIIKLKLQHVDLEEKSIFIRGGKELCTRKISLHPRQLVMISEYIETSRKALLKGKKSDAFFINYRGMPDKRVDNVQYVVEMLQPAFPDRNLTTTTIRDSTIAHWLNEKKIKLESVQLLAGHRWISSTQRYVNSSTDEQREKLNRFFPLKC